MTKVVLCFGLCSKHSDDEIDDAVEDKGMDVDDSKDEEIANALAVAQALGKSSESTKSETKYDDIADGLKELDMDNYDDEDDGILILSFNYPYCFFYDISFR